jgi:peptidoglycan/LPS O-acetylase OafA/YrhL
VAHGFAWLNTSFFAKFWLFPLTSLSICGVLLGLHVRLPRLLGGAIGFIARISYSMYLSNIAVLLVMIRLLGFGESTYDKLLRISIFFGLVIIVSTITYYLIENPSCECETVSFLPVERCRQREQRQPLGTEGRVSFTTA